MPAARTARNRSPAVCVVSTSAEAGAPVIISGNYGTVRVWRLADGTPVVPPLGLPTSVRAAAVHGHVIVTAAGTDIAVHQPALSQHMC